MKPRTISWPKGAELRALFGLFVMVVALYILVGRWGPTANVDVLATNGPAWRIATAGTMEVSFLVDRTPWLVTDAQGRTLSDRAPGLILAAIPAYAVSQPKEFTNAPGTVVAIAVTTAALVAMYMLLRRYFEWQYVILAVGVLALGTTTWTTSASQLWPHGPGQLVAALAMLGLASGHYARTGLAFAAGILIRPVTAIFPLLVGVYQSWKMRTPAPALKIGIISGSGFALLLFYYRVVFGEWVMKPGYNPAESLGNAKLVSYTENLLNMFVSWPNGFLIFTPVVGVAAFGAVKGWRQIPVWARSGALAAIVYLLAHVALNRASGGMPVFYRYPLEPITLATPALAFGAHSLHSTGRLYARALKISAMASVAAHAIMAFWLSCRTASPDLLSCQLFG